MSVTRELRTASVIKKINREQKQMKYKYKKKVRKARMKILKTKYQQLFIDDLNGLRVGFPDKRVRRRLKYKVF